MGTVELSLGWQDSQLGASLLTESGTKMLASISDIVFTSMQNSLTQLLNWAVTAVKGGSLILVRKGVEFPALQLQSNGQAEAATLWHLISNPQAGFCLR